MKYLPTLAIPLQPIPLDAPPVRCGPYDQIVINGKELTCVGAVNGVTKLALVDNPLVTQTLSRADWNLVRHSRGFRHKRDFYNPEVAQARKHAGVAYVRDLPDEEQKEILWKQKWCLAALRRKNLDKADPEKISFSDESLLIAIPQIAKEIGKLEKVVTLGGKRKRAGQKIVVIEGPGPKCLREWCAALVAGSMNPLALRNQLRKCGNRLDKLEPEEYAFVRRYAAKIATPEKPKPASLWRLMKAAIGEENKKGAPTRQLKVPSEKRLRQEINDISKYEIMVGQVGPEIARNYFRAITTGLPNVVRPLQRVEFDEWEVHLHVLAIMTGIWDTWSDEQRAKAEKIRLVLCIALDVATKCVVGMSLASKASPENAVRCLENAVSDKQPYADAAGAVTPFDICGSIETAVADAGSSFANYDFSAKMVDLGTKYTTTVAGLPWLRGNVERIFRSIDDKFVSLFAGRTFGNVVEKGEYDSEGKACLLIDELALALVRYKVDHYHNSPHEGLAGETPRSAWLRLTEEFGVDGPPDDHLRRTVFGDKRRTMLGNHGLRVFGIDYQSVELNELFKQAGNVYVDLRVDQRNLGAISAKIGDEWEEVEGPPELFRVTAEDWIAVWDELQARNAAVNAITSEILDNTMNYLVEVGRIARARRNIAEEPMDEATLVYHDKRMNVGVNFARDRIVTDKKAAIDLHEGALVVGGDGPDGSFHHHDVDPASDALARLPISSVKPERTHGTKKSKQTPVKSRDVSWKFED